MSAPDTLPYSKIRIAKGFVFLAGVALNGNNGMPEGISAQTAAVLKQITGTLGTVGLGLDDVVQVAVHLVDGADFSAFNAEYRKHFQEPFPVRTTVVANLLAPGALIEITATAVQRY